MRVSTKRILAIGAAFLFFVGALLVYFNLVRTESTVVNDLRAKILSKSNLLAAQREVVGQVQNLIAQFQNVARVRDSVSLAVPEGVESVQALRQIEAIARASAVTLTSLEFKSGPAVAVKKSTVQTTGAGSLLKKLGILKITVAAIGPYESLKIFLAELETTVRIANVQTFKYAPLAGQGGMDRLTVDVEMYYQQE
jgi:hypothetical protein